MSKGKKPNLVCATLNFSLIFKSGNVRLSTFKHFHGHAQAAVVVFIRFIRSEKNASSLSF